MKPNKQHIVSYKTYLIIWAILMFCTFLTVAAAQIDLKNLVVFTALLIATTKAVIVGAYFMHLKFESKILALMLGLTMMVFITFMILTFIDYSFR